jgi:hypothetical protein
MGKPTVAKPKGFILKMRLVAPDGTPFANRWYRVQWGNAVFPPPEQPAHQTDKDGALVMLLPAGSKTKPQGSLFVLDHDGTIEKTAWRIPLHIVDDPLAAALPELGQVPAPPTAGASADAWENYKNEVIKFRDTLLVPYREKLYLFEQEWEALREIVTWLPRPPKPNAPEEELIQAWSMFRAAHALASAAYETAWRLWNLAHLPLYAEPSYPLRGSDVPFLLRALARFARKRGERAQYHFDAAEKELDNLKRAHDLRGPLNP